MTTQLPGDTQRREHTTLPLSMLPFWLGTLNANMVAPELRDTLIAYQTEAADVLFRHFFRAHPPVVAARIAGPFAGGLAGGSGNMGAGQRNPRITRPSPPGIRPSRQTGEACDRSYTATAPGTCPPPRTPTPASRAPRCPLASRVRPLAMRYRRTVIAVWRPARPDVW